VPATPRGRQILDRFPDAVRVVVALALEHPRLHGNAGVAEDWLKIKKTRSSSGIRKGLKSGPTAARPTSSRRLLQRLRPGLLLLLRPLGARATPTPSPLRHIEGCGRAIARHAARLGPKTERNQVDPESWVYDNRRERRTRRSTP
jgi:hypothetical protein